MKNTEIRNIFDMQERIKLCNELCHYISIRYSLKEPSHEFFMHLSNVLKKYFGFLTFEQIESAFEYNSIGSLNEYLPKTGMSIDNKVKFTIPDLTKILRAFCRFKNLDIETVKKTNEWSQEKINEIHNEWITQLNDIFEKYMNELEKTSITIPTYTCDYLSKIGVLVESKIDRTKALYKVSFNKKIKVKNTHNENLIYETFDILLEQGRVLFDYLI